MISISITRRFYPEQTQPLFGTKSNTASLTSSLKPKQMSCPHTEPATTKTSFYPGRTPCTGPCKGCFKSSLRCLRSSLTRTLLRDLFGQATSPQCPPSRALNAITVRHRYPLPLSQEITYLLLRKSEGAYNSIINHKQTYTHVSTTHGYTDLYIYITCSEEGHTCPSIHHPGSEEGHTCPSIHHPGSEEGHSGLPIGPRWKCCKSDVTPLHFGIFHSWR